MEMIRSERSVSGEVRAQLVDGLFHPFASLVAGALGGLWIAVTVTMIEEDAVVTAVADAIVLVALGRIALGLYYLGRKKPASEADAAKWEFAFASIAAVFAFGMGMVCLLAITRIDNSALHLMLTTTTAGYAASIAGRNAGRPWVALSQLYLAATPMCLGLILHGDTFYQMIGLVLFIFMFGMTDITTSLRKTIVTALETKRQNAELARSFEAQATLFDAALNNMSHGLCMFDRGGALLVWNHKFLEILERKGERLAQGMSLDDVMDWLEAGPAAGADVTRLAETIRLRAGRARAQQSFVNFGPDRVISVSSQRMENGNTVLVFEDVSEQAKANERIKQLAWTDELTALMNRAAFQELFSKSLRLRKPDERMALHIVDLDLFKEVNDTLGHPIGDLLLKEVAKRIQAVCGQGAHVGRLGGDEFVIIQPLNGPGADPEALAARVIARIGQTFEIAGHRINIGASGGIALAPVHGDQPDVLMKRADMALYKAKAHGRNSVTVFENDLDFQAQERRMLELDLRAAIEHEQFTLVFQPIGDIATGELETFETLIRWTHPERGAVSPAEFIPVAEETGLIIEIGRFVLERACRAAAVWNSDATVAVNFSAVQFTDTEFPAFVAEILAATGLPARRLELEVTETALLGEDPGNLTMLNRFRDMGVRVSLDDFGTGYSSLSQLRTFPFDRIKIDGSFVRDLGRDASAVAVIHAVTSIGRIMDMSVVAECVESEDQLNFLVNAGCTHIQGYLLGRPQPAERIHDTIAAHSKGWLRAAV